MKGKEENRGEEEETEVEEKEEGEEGEIKNKRKCERLRKNFPQDFVI